MPRAWPESAIHMIAAWVGKEVGTYDDIAEPQSEVPLAEARSGRVDISGPMSGLPDFNLSACHAAGPIPAKSWARPARTTRTPSGAS